MTLNEIYELETLLSRQWELLKRGEELREAEIERLQELSAKEAAWQG